jgi:hypothetical protein
VGLVSAWGCECEMLLGHLLASQGGERLAALSLLPVRSASRNAKTAWSGPYSFCPAVVAVLLPLGA